MIKLLPVIVLIFSTSAFAKSQFVINGLKTDGFNPVVKLRIGSGEGSSRCTGTFIAKQIILTAAHCIDGFYRNLLDHASHHPIPPIIPGEKISYELFINGEEFSRVEEIYKMPLDNTKMIPSGSYSQLVQRLVEITRPSVFSFGQKYHPFSGHKQMYKNNELSLYRKAFYSHVNALASPAADIAIIKVKYKPYDDYYQLSQDKLYENTKVKLVGYGLSITPGQMMKLNQELVKYESKVKNASFDFTKKSHQKSLETVMKQIEKNNYGIKRYGDNVINEVAEGIYYLAGKAKTDETSWNNFTKLFYSWEKASGKQATVSSGDSGGPLLKKVGDSYAVYGVASMIFDFSTKESLEYFKSEGLIVSPEYRGKAMSVYGSTYTNEFNQFYQAVMND